MYRYNMTSIFEVSPNKGYCKQKADKDYRSNRTGCDHYNKDEKKDEPISRRYFLICQTCFGVPLILIQWITLEDLPVTRRVLYAMIMESNRYQSRIMNIIFEYTATRGVRPTPLPLGLLPH